MAVMLQKREELLLNDSIPYLQSFIKEFKGFYPFAMIMDKMNIISSLSPEIENELINSQYLIDLFKRSIYAEYAKLDNEYVLSIICIDILIHELIKDVDITKNGTEFIFISPSYEKKIQLEYKIDENGDAKFIY